jgi:molecular chaperone DnaK (HSP70)
VTYIQENEIEIGIPAQQKSNTKFISSVYEIKRFIGKKLNEVKNKEKFPFPFLDDGK